MDSVPLLVRAHMCEWEAEGRSWDHPHPPAVSVTGGRDSPGCPGLAAPGWLHLHPGSGHVCFAGLLKPFPAVFTPEERGEAVLEGARGPRTGSAAPGGRGEGLSPPVSSCPVPPGPCARGRGSPIPTPAFSPQPPTGPVCAPGDVLPLRWGAWGTMGGFWI